MSKPKTLADAVISGVSYDGTSLQVEIRVLLCDGSVTHVTQTHEVPELDYDDLFKRFNT